MKKYISLGINGLIQQNITQVTLLLTSRCSLRCKMCFYWEQVDANDSDELSLDEIEQMSLSMPRFFWLLLGGGEPFVRKDLPAIVKMFYLNNHISHVSIPTNSINTQQIISQVEQVLQQCPKVYLNIVLSLNGIGDDHNQVCQSDIAFKCFLQTYNQLSVLKQKYSNLGLGINITHSHYTEHKLEDIIDFVVTDLSLVDNISVAVVRGNPKEPEAAHIDVNYYKKAIGKIESLVIQKRIKMYSGFFGRMSFVKDMIMRRVIIRTLLSGWQCPCLAGKLTIVIDEKANLYPCEVLAPLGNLRDFDFNVRDLLYSDGVQEKIGHIQTENCYCTHECVYSMNIVFSPRYWPYLIWNYIKLHSKMLFNRNVRVELDDMSLPKMHAKKQHNGQLSKLY